MLLSTIQKAKPPCWKWSKTCLKTAGKSILLIVSLSQYTLTRFPRTPTPSSQALRIWNIPKTQRHLSQRRSYLDVSYQRSRISRRSWRRGSHSVSNKSSLVNLRISWHMCVPMKSCKFHWSTQTRRCWSTCLSSTQLPKRLRCHAYSLSRFTLTREFLQQLTCTPSPTNQARLQTSLTSKPSLASWPPARTCKLSRLPKWSPWTTTRKWVWQSTPATEAKL